MSASTASSDSVQAELEFIVPPPNGERPWVKATEGFRTKSYDTVTREVPIENWRNQEGISLDTTGFQIVSNSPTKFIENGELLVEGYYEESIKLIKQVTGATRVQLFDHTIRRRRLGVVEDSSNARQPGKNAHIDQTSASAVARVHRHLPAEDVPKLLSKRFQIINLWRPISHPALDWPLALCDYRSVDPVNDVQPVALIYPHMEGEIFLVKHNPNQRWGYFRGMRPDEFVLIKCFDSVQNDNVAKFTPHTAFADPTTPKDAPLRESVELRALVFYD